MTTGSEERQVASAPTDTTWRHPNGLAGALRPLAVDVATPIATYYLLTGVFGVPLVTALAASSVLPILRTVSGVTRQRRISFLAALVLTVNLGGIALNFVTGDARVMIAKDSGISSITGLVTLWSVVRDRPVMTAAVEPYLTRGHPERIAGWQRLCAESAAFRRQLARYTLIWAIALLTECAARIVGSFTLPVATMVWLSTVLVITSIAFAIVVGGAVTVPMDRMLTDADGTHRTILPTQPSKEELAP
jgi:hypothetical protein